MYGWIESIQKMIDWIEEHICDNPSLLDMSKQIGYSPYYCSTKFHEIVGMTIKTYISGRRLAIAALAIRDTEDRILDIALNCGYSSQEALTRAFINAYGCTPAYYRKRKQPIALSVRQVILAPWNFIDKGESTMNTTVLTDAKVRVQYIPAHKFIGIWDSKAENYGNFWNHHDCDNVCGIIDSMSHVADPIITGHTAGWAYIDGKKGYFYGLGVPDDFNGEIPDGFEIRKIPGSYYLVFYHPTFDFLKDCDEVMTRVENLAWSFDPKQKGFEWNDNDLPTYQRHFPEEFGYEVLRPVKKIDK